MSLERAIHDSNHIIGIDVGAGYTKCVVCKDDGAMLGSNIIKTDPNFDKSAMESMRYALQSAGISQMDYLITTGVGRYSVKERNIQVTDVTATARGVSQLLPGIEFVLDIGGQVTKAIKIDGKGRVKDFKCNEKCAAGSGSFIEKAVKYLEVKLEDVGKLALKATEPQPISSICAILAESEIINHVSEGKSVENILMGVYESLADRSMLLLKRVGFNGTKCAFVGGLALQAGMIQACKKKFGSDVCIPESPQLITAYGAALMGIQRLKKIQTVQA
ncbi:MAG: hypothetical protein HY606_05480 [Planctomycetes bacterium]|nr:hypothetical protein [Planctomycetota bacterium]